MADTAGRTLVKWRGLFASCLAGSRAGLTLFAPPHSGRFGQALLQLQAVGSEAERERSARLAFGPETGPLLRTLLRLRHDLVIVGRAARSGSLGGVGARLKPRLAEVAAAFGEYLSASGAALLARRPPPSLSAAKSALSAHAAEVAALLYIASGPRRTFPAKRRNAFLLSASPCSRFTRTSGISSSAWLSGRNRPRMMYKGRKYESGLAFPLISAPGRASSGGLLAASSTPCCHSATPSFKLAQQWGAT